MTDHHFSALRRDLDCLRADILSRSAEDILRWTGWIDSPAFEPSARNLAQYLAFRHHDLRDMQRRLMQAGLSSLGHAESRVLPTLDAVLALLSAVTDGTPLDGGVNPEFFAGEARLAERAQALLGPLAPGNGARLMVTLPSEAAEDPRFAKRLAALGVESVRINCAHDDAATWEKMIVNVRAAARASDQSIKVMMDLPGPKIRTGKCRDKKGLERVFLEDRLAIVRPGQLDRAPHRVPSMECTLVQALDVAKLGDRVFIDDGKLTTVVESVEPWGLVLRILVGADDKGYKLKPEKGINFPDSELRVPALTEDDRALLPFIARHADAVEFSFVQDADDVADLQAELARLRPDDWQALGLVLKVETRRAVRNLPDMLVRAAGRQPTAIMIARGDLAVEIGFARLAEMQEEILWIGEAAQVPVIWATQVMESYLKTGIPSRGDMTDAAMAARAECVMLNKGPFLFKGIAELTHLINRMSGHISKKTPHLRALHSW